mgnify:CR=1 FL=1
MRSGRVLIHANRFVQQIQGFIRSAGAQRDVRLFDEERGEPAVEQGAERVEAEGFRVPAGQVYTAVESPKGELGCHLVSSGGTRPYRVHFRDPSFTNLQAVAAMSEGGMISDIIAAVAIIDPVMGGVDR